MVLEVQGSVRQSEGQLMGRLTCGNPTDDPNSNAASDSGQKATSHTWHLTDARKVGERQPLHTKGSSDVA